jgi:glycosyltransferase involved in cell wall biosynthesis
MGRGRGRRILIDGSMARGGGGFTYLVNILPTLSALAPDDRFRVLVRSERLAQSIAPAPNLEVERLPEVGVAQRLRFTYAELPKRLRSWGADLYFSAGESAPLRAHCPMIASFRNPIPYAPRDPLLSSRIKLRLWALRVVTRISARACDRIMFVSHDSARWIGDLFGVPPHRRAVVHHGIDLAAWARPVGAGVGSAARRGSILSVSSVHRHKNYVRLIQAWAELARRRDALPDLVIIGDNQDPDYWAEMQRAREATGPLAERIRILGEVPYAEVRRYYADADVFVFPSYLETFGHPMVEAMASRAPVVAADTPVFREIGGDAARYADPYRVDALAEAIEQVLFAPGERDALVARGLARAAELSWDATARRLSALFDEVCSERAGAAR